MAVYAAFYGFSLLAFTTYLVVTAEMGAGNQLSVTIMFGSSALDKISGLANRFVRADGGNIAILFAFALVPLLGLIGAAVDYARTATARSAMQAAMDSTSLMLAKDLNSGIISGSDINAKAQNYFKALYTNGDAKGVTIAATYTAKSSSGTSTVNVTGSGFVTTDFMKVAGFPQMTFDTNSTSTWGNTKLRVAMALDVTGSMDSAGKLDAMKKAAKGLIDTLKKSAQASGDVYISIIPFAQMVNVGKGNKDAAWLDWDTDYGSCSKSKYTLKSDCEGHGKTWTSNNVSNWKGCVTDREQSYDTTKDAPTTVTPDTLFLAKDYSACSSSILPMTSAYDSKEADDSTDDKTLKGKINNLVANGGTNQAIGMHWAWMMLQPTEPFVTPAKDAKYKYTDAIILLSDGLNTIDRWYGNGHDQSPEVDARQTLLCTNIKNFTLNGATSIYTIQVNTDGDAESTVLKGCADSGSFYSSTTASGIAAAFGSIGASLSKLRIAQ